MSERQLAVTVVQLHEGEFAGSYQISDDYLRTEEYPNPRAYRRRLLCPDLNE